MCVSQAAAGDLAAVELLLELGRVDLTLRNKASHPLPRIAHILNLRQT